MQFNHSKLNSLPSAGRFPCNIIVTSCVALLKVSEVGTRGPQLGAEEARSALSETHAQCLTHKRAVKEAANDRHKVI